jgi:hypothetical protein
VEAAVLPLVQIGRVPICRRIVDGHEGMGSRSV